MPDFPTFRLVDAHDDELEIERDNDYGDTVAAVRSEGGNTVYVKREESPAVALAILEAAQAHNLDGAVAQAIVCLRGHLAYTAAQKRREEAEREEAARLAAEEEARLEKERLVDRRAKDLLNALRTSSIVGMRPVASLDEVPVELADAWRQVAKVALASA